MAYDVFLSHPSVDKAWTRALCSLIQGTDYNGRPLRAWLDERVLDPGLPASPRELESALEASRFLVLVLSPEALASTWVRDEIEHFVDRRGPEAVIVIHRRPCDVPARLDRARQVDWCDATREIENREQLLEILMPERWDPVFGRFDHVKQVQRAWSTVKWAQPPPGVYDATTNAANSELLELLLAGDIGDLDAEGGIVSNFAVVGGLTSELDAEESYHLKMVLGEYLAVAQLDDIRYGRIWADFVKRDLTTARSGPSFLLRRNRALADRGGRPSTTNLLFAVARAASKVAELDPARIDRSALWAVLGALDEQVIAGRCPRPQALTVASMVARVVGKLRGTPGGELLVHSLVRAGGPMSRVAAAGAIATRFDHDDDLVYYTVELAARAARSGEQARLAPPSPSIACYLDDRDSPLGADPSVAAEVERARADLGRFFPDRRSSPGRAGAGVRAAPPIDALSGGPLIGCLRLVTRATMERRASELGPGDLAVLTEPRIVDDLFAGVSGFVVMAEQRDGPLVERLEQRGSRYAVVAREWLGSLPDGAELAIWSDRAADAPGGLLLGATPAT